MSKQHIIKTVLISVLSLIVTVGLFFFVLFQINLYKSIKNLDEGLREIITFVNKEFPSNVQHYVSSVSNQQTKSEVKK